MLYILSLNENIVIGFYVETNPKVLFYSTIISFLVFKIHTFKMRCRLKIDCQDSLKLKQFVKNSLCRYMDIMNEFSKMTVKIRLRI